MLSDPEHRYCMELIVSSLATRAVEWVAAVIPMAYALRGRISRVVSSTDLRSPAIPAAAWVAMTAMGCVSHQFHEPNDLLITSSPAPLALGWAEMIPMAFVSPWATPIGKTRLTASSLALPVLGWAETIAME